MFYGKGGEKPGIFQNSAEAKGDYEVRDSAQAKTQRHNFKCDWESDFRKHMGVWMEHLGSCGRRPAALLV